MSEYADLNPMRVRHDSVQSTVAGCKLIDPRCASRIRVNIDLARNMDQPSTSQAALADDDVTNRFLQGELSYDEYMRQTGGLDMTAEVAEMGLEHEEEVDDEELEQDLRTIAHVVCLLHIPLTKNFLERN